MKWENLELFCKMENIISILEKKPIERIENDCDHNFKDIDGIYTCINCGLTNGEVYDNDGIQYENKLGYRPYQRQKHLRDLINRISGHKYKEIKDVDIEEMPYEMREIRKYLRKNKLHQKNDYYYWRIKNNIETKISGTDLYIWCAEFRKIKTISPHNFLYQKFSDNEKYSMFVELFKKIVPT